ncbi:MAG: ribosome assembly RNA-binding protein YhbY [Gammaproteobacteria bacterium]|jgi:RNA-binding protein|nr:ribosome assembly RNA-binding protein YhbY [Gammaproteobacteria bacterium]|tara:strand:- start:985 stop:1290 length:306 start_codon:yes stop_codon:yes gene_type:complete
MSLSSTAKKRYRAIGHRLKPVVSIAEKGLTENVRLELERALTDHELIKVKVTSTDRKEKKLLTNLICDELKAECVQSIGHMALFFRKAKQANPKLSNLLRE